LEEVTGEDIEKTREQLVSVIARELTIQERQFVVSAKERMLQWELAGVDCCLAGRDALLISTSRRGCPA
jgi:hypothetical protein